MAKSPNEHIRDLSLEVRAIRERETALRDHLDDLKARDEKREKENAEIRRELTEVRQENAVLKQQLQDHVKHNELSDARRWAFVLAFMSALLALASGLIISLTRK